MIGLAKGGGFSSLGVGFFRWISLAFLMTALIQLPGFRKLTGYKSMEKKDWFKSFFLGLILFGPSHLLFYASMGLTSEVEGTVLLSTSPLWTGMFAFFVLKERMTTQRALAIGLSAVGAYTVAVGFKFPDLLGHTKGNLMFGAGVILECFMGVFAAKISRRTSGVSVLCGQIWGGATTFLLFALFASSALPLQMSLNPSGLFPVLYLVLFSGLISFTVWYRIVETTPLTLLVIGIAIQPPIATLLNWLVKNELPQANTLIGAVIILTALALGFGKEKAPSPNLDTPGPA